MPPAEQPDKARRAAGRRGRRPGRPDTRAAILGAARQHFAASGYAGTSMRGVAAAAGVDPALVHHYFGTKADLFLEALEIPIDPRSVLAPVIAGDPARAGEHLLRNLLSIWNDERQRLPLLALLRGVFEPSGQPRILDGFLQVVGVPLGTELNQAELRLSLVASQVLGLVLMLYVVELEPLASIPAESLVAIYAPTLQRYLTGPLP